MLPLRGSRAGAVLWLFCFQFFVAEQVARLHVRGPYSMVRNVISDLGAVHCFGLNPQAATSCSPLHLLMNTSFVLQGLLIFFGALLVRPLFPSRALWTAAFLLFELSGGALIFVGLAPEDVSGDVHVLAATLHFLCGSLAMLVLGLALLKRTKSNELAGTLSIGAGMIALAATLLLGLTQTTEWPVGAVERIAAYPLPLWLSITGLILVTRRPRVLG